jgi:hypothetical protein
MKYIFMMYASDIARINIFVLTHDKTIQCLTLTKNYMQTIFGQREYR